MTTPKKLFGARIKRLRESKGWTQEYLAERMDISSNYLSGMERGRENPAFDMLVKLSDAISADMWEIFDFRHEERPSELRKMLQDFAEEIDEEKLRLSLKIIRAITR